MLESFDLWGEDSQVVAGHVQFAHLLLCKQTNKYISHCKLYRYKPGWLLATSNIFCLRNNTLLSYLKTFVCEMMKLVMCFSVYETGVTL